MHELRLVVRVIVMQPPWLRIEPSTASDGIADGDDTHMLAGYDTIKLRRDGKNDGRPHKRESHNIQLRTCDDSLAAQSTSSDEATWISPLTWIDLGLLVDLASLGDVAVNLLLLSHGIVLDTSGRDTRRVVDDVLR